MTEDINITGLREKPLKDKNGILEPEQPYHMTSVLRRLFPKVLWRQGSKENTLVDLEGNKVDKKMGGSLQPDFLSTELALIVEIDGNSDVKYGGHFTSTEQAIKDIVVDGLKAERLLDNRRVALLSFFRIALHEEAVAFVLEISEDLAFLQVFQPDDRP